MESDAMQKTKDVRNGDKLTVDQWFAIRKQAGLRIDPETAEVIWKYVQILDPYGVSRNQSAECDEIVVGYFARSPGSDVWVWFGDIPEATVDALFERMKAEIESPDDDCNLWDEE